MLIKKLGTIIATASLLVAAFTPSALAETVIDISGNGSSSTNLVTVSNSNTTVVDQSSKTKANTTVNLSGNTGNNNANGNVGGTVAITTGEVTNTAVVTVTGGDNTATLPEQCGCDPVTDVSIVGNGTDSLNKVNVGNANVIVVGQKAKTKAKTVLTSKGKTGKNTTNNNVGSGVGVVTGSVTNTSIVTVTGGSNTLNP